jgi:hypothetical protein
MTSKVDIVKLIESDPITSLSKDYQSKLINKIKSNFPSNNQRLFVANFYSYLNYSKTDFVISLDDVWKWLGFVSKGNAKTMLTKTFNDKIDYQRVFLQPQKNSKGGRPTENITMTINTFKKLCLKAGTSKADEIHDYYIRLEELLYETLNEETNELKEQLQLKENEAKHNESKHKEELKLQRHKMLLEILKTKRCVYIGEIKENEFIKIGSSKGINERNKQLTDEYGNMIFLEVFECDYFREVEDNILKDPTVRKHLYKESIKLEGGKSKEVIQLSEKFNYKQLLTIVQKYVKETNFFTPTQLLEKQKMDLEEKKLSTQLLLKALDDQSYSKEISKILIEQHLPKILENINVNSTQEPEQIKQLEKNETQNPVHKMEIMSAVKGRAPKGRKVQKIDPDNLENIIKVYDSMVYVLRDPDNVGFQKSCIQRAINKNTVYKGFRWNFVEDGDDPNISTVEDTVLCKKPSIRSTVLQLNETKTEIIESFHTRNAVEKKFGMSKTTFRKFLNVDSKLNGCYYVTEDNCPPKLLENYKKPLNKIIYTHSKKVKQINPITNESIVFNTLNEVYIKFGFADTTIREAIKFGTLCGGFKWEYA